MLRQISLTKSSVLDLRNQLTDAQSSASHSHEVLEAQVHSCRERKRQEDAARAEMKVRTKTLEDSKRQAEGVRKDAEKRLKATQHARDEAQQRISHLDSEIVKIRERLATEKAQAEAQKLELEAEEQRLEASLESKKREAKVAEDVVAALNLRARELEEKLAAGKERLRLAKEQVELRKQDRSTQTQVASPAVAPWPQAAAQHYRDSSSETSPDQRVVKQPSSPRPTKLSLTGLPPFEGFSSNGPANLNSTYRSNKGYAIFDKDLASLQAHPVPLPPLSSTTTFAPFDDEPMSPPLTTPTGSAFIPSSLMENIDNMSRSFQSDNDMPLEREWRSGQRRSSLDTHNHGLSYSASTTNTSSPSAMNPASYSDEVDPFEVRILPHHRQFNDQRWTVDNVEPQRRQQQEPISPLYRSSSDPTKHADSISFEDGVLDLPKLNGTPRRWFTTREKPKNGLNPDAKVFSLTPKRDAVNPVISKYSGLAPSMISAPLHHHQLHHGLMNGSSHAYDALNPTGLLHLGHQPASSHTSSFLRAFAPSPEEREALQRALGGSANTSLERLPSLGSIPSSPTQIHTDAVSLGGDQHRKGIPGWLQSLQLPLKRKTNFSPWDDEVAEPVGSNTSSSGLRAVGSR